MEHALFETRFLRRCLDAISQRTGIRNVFLRRKSSKFARCWLTMRIVMHLQGIRAEHLGSIFCIIALFEGMPAGLRIPKTDIPAVFVKMDVALLARMWPKEPMQMLDHAALSRQRSPWDEDVWRDLGCGETTRGHDVRGGFWSGWYAFYPSPFHVADCVNRESVINHRRTCAERPGRVFDGVSWPSMQMRRNPLFVLEEARFSIVTIAEFTSYSILWTGRREVQRRD